MESSSSMVKEKSSSTRIYDEEGFKRRAACICVKSEAEDEVLLISSGSKPGIWKVPGGGVEPGEDPSDAAAREVMEEAGVLGNVGRSLGVFENPDRKERTEVFVMIVKKELEDWDEAKTRNRKRQWFSMEEAIEQVALYKPLQRNYLQQLCLSRAPKKLIQTL
ncbi:diphosphoinositol polyphosphate phosphohydrolase 2-like isoform X1 [Harmonia axyridis]|uniref:diphosphoinositol polyphosphate phosphohydrolase 2-like isoform X1 n=2 Tax=Harmonia axyridis TaxID=115357 RepID=UPI001E279774|nr:diphosphoinositol polyphosphate phosphohydrolase 2-like isoform X1 [Harmonia axyridis]